MEDTASLRIAINTGEIKNANTELDKLSKTSLQTEQSANKVTSSFFSLGRVLSSIALLGTAQQFIKMADTMTGVESKLKLVTKNTFDLTIAQQELFQISQKTRQGYAETVNTYSNFALAMGEMGKSQKDILRVTETVNKAIAISGGTAQMAAAATLQLGQAFASGTLRGDELNSILENSKGLAQAIADGMGVPIGQLRTLGTEGKITADVLANALEKSAKSVDEKFGKVGVTVEASMTVLANSITNMIGKADKQLGATGTLGTLITDISKHIDENTQDWVNSVQSAMDTMYPVAEAGFISIRDLSEVTFEGVNALFSVMVHAFDGAVESMDNKYRELGFFDYMSLGFIVVIEGFRQLASGGLSALTFLGKQFNTFQSIALDAIAGVMGAMGKFQNAVGGDGSSFLEAQTFWANKANKVKQDGLLIDRTQKAILDDMGKGVDRLIGSYDKLALKKVKAKEVDNSTDGKDKPKYGATGLTKEQIAAAKKAEAERIKDAKELAKQNEKINEEIALARASDYEKQQLEIEKSVKEYRKAGVSKSEINRLISLKQGEYLDAEYTKAQEQFTKLDEAKLASLTIQAQMMADNYVAMYDQHLRFTMSTFEYDMMKLNEQKEAYLRATEDKLAVDTWYEEQKMALQNKEASDDVSKSLEPMQTMLDTQIALAESGKDWASSLTGVAGSMADVIKGLQKVNVIGLKTDKALIKSQEKYAKSFLDANGDIVKEKVAMAQFDNEQNTIKNDQFQSEVSAYSDMAGVASTFFEKGSSEAKAMAVIQGGLAIVSAGSGGDPYTVIPRMIAAAAMVAQTLSASGISGGGSSSPAPIANSGTVLGDSSAVSKSTTNIVGLLEKIHVSEYSELRDINKAVTSMAKGIEGTVTNLFRSGALDTSGVSLTSRTDLGGRLPKRLPEVIGGGMLAKTLPGVIGGGMLVAGVGILTGIALMRPLISAIFGGSVKQSIRASGLDISGGSLAQKVMGNVGASSFVDIETNKRGLFGKHSYSYNKQNTALDDATSNSISLIYQSFDDTMKSINEGLGTHLEKTINDYQFSAVSLNLKGLTGDEATKRLNDMFSAQGDKMVTNIFGNLIMQYQHLGEGLLETAVRVITEKAVVIQDLGDIGKTVSGDIIGISQSLVGLSGSLGDFKDNVSSYYDKYFSDEEKLARSKTKFLELFSDLGIAMPTTSQAFRGIVDSLDLTTYSGQEMFTTLMGVSGAFYDFSKSSEDIVSNFGKLKTSLFGNIKAFIDSLSGSLSTKDPAVSFYTFTSSFNSMIDSIEMGSENLLDVGDTALKNAQSYLDVVTATATSQRDIDFAKAMLVNKFSGVIATPDLTLNNINSTLNTNNAQLIAELQALKFELNSIKNMTIDQNAAAQSSLISLRGILGSVSA